MQPVSDPKPFQFKLWHLFALVSGTAVVFSFISFISVRGESNRRRECVGRLKQLGLALHSYHYAFDCFPPPYVTDAQGKPLYSWRVLILTYAEGTKLWSQWRFDEPWDSAHNQSLWDELGPPYDCPVARRNRPPGTPQRADYLAVVGPGMAWEAGKCLSLHDFADGGSNTILLVEVRGSQIHWAEPVDVDGTASLKINAPRGLSIGSHGSGGVNVLFVDGSVVHLPDTTSEEQIKALLTRAGGENVDWLRDMPVLRK